MAEGEPVVRKSIVRKSITRKYNTAKYETMDILVDHSIEVEWDTVAALRAKSDGITKLVADDFEQTAKKVFEEYKLNTIAAIVNAPELPRKGLSADEKKDYDAIA